MFPDPAPPAETKKAVYFDLDEHELKRCYPKRSYKHAWDDVARYLFANGFERAQYSVYHSVAPMSEAATLDVVFRLSDALPWLPPCVKAISFSDVPETHNLIRAFRPKGD